MDGVGGGLLPGIVGSLPVLLLIRLCHRLEGLVPQQGSCQVAGESGGRCTRAAAEQGIAGHAAEMASEHKAA